MSCENHTLSALVVECVEASDVDAPPNFPRLSIAITVQTYAVATTNHQDVRVIDDAGTTVPVSSEGLDSDHVPGVYLSRSRVQADCGCLWITVAVPRCLCADGFPSDSMTVGESVFAIDALRSARQPLDMRVGLLIRTLTPRCARGRPCPRAGYRVCVRMKGFTCRLSGRRVSQSDTWVRCGFSLCVGH